MIHLGREETARPLAKCTLCDVLVAEISAFYPISTKTSNPDDDYWFGLVFTGKRHPHALCGWTSVTLKGEPSRASPHFPVQALAYVCPYKTGQRRLIVVFASQPTGATTTSRCCPSQTVIPKWKQRERQPKKDQRKLRWAWVSPHILL